MSDPWGTILYLHVDLISPQSSFPVTLAVSPSPSWVSFNAQVGRQSIRPYLWINIWACLTILGSSRSSNRDILLRCRNDFLNCANLNYLTPRDWWQSRADLAEYQCSGGKDQVVFSLHYKLYSLSKCPFLNYFVDKSWEYVHSSRQNANPNNDLWICGNCFIKGSACFAWIIWTPNHFDSSGPYRCKLRPD